MLSKLYHAALGPYYRVKMSYPVWYHALNREAVKRHHIEGLPLSEEGRRIVVELKQNGIAVSSLDKLFPDKRWLQIFQEWEREHPHAESTSGKKQFWRQYWDLLPTLDFGNPFLRFSLEDEILSIGHHYMGMWLRLRQYLLAKTLPVGDAEPVLSQRWHKDPTEKKWFKCFIYLNDVDETAGPFTYMLESNYDGKYGALFPQNFIGGTYPPTDEVDKTFPKENVQVMTAKAGTVIFCDVAGLHYGGHARTSPRIMFTACYNAPSFPEACHFKWSEEARREAQKLSPAAQFALGGRTLTHKTGSSSM